jgi:hypothetical protein
VTTLSAGAEITAVKAGSQAVIIDTSRQRWVVRDVSEQFEVEPSFRLYNVSGPEVIDPPQTLDGVAVTSSGELFHLNDAAGFRRFWHAAREELSPLELAGLLSTYQSEAPSSETIVLELGDIPASAARGAIPPDVANAGPLMIRFVTQYFTEEPPDYVARRHLNEWSVREEEAGELDWFWAPMPSDDV